MQILPKSKTSIRDFLTIVFKHQNSVEDTKTHRNVEVKNHMELKSMPLRKGKRFSSGTAGAQIYQVNTTVHNLLSGETAVNK